MLGHAHIAVGSVCDRMALPVGESVLGPEDQKAFDDFFASEDDNAGPFSSSSSKGNGSVCAKAAVELLDICGTYETMDS